jgi:hypothetical protein
MKQKLLAGMMALPLLAFTPQAFAAVVNTDTGECSENVVVFEMKTSSTVINSNDVNLDNDADVHISTGDNEIGGEKPIYKEEPNLPIGGEQSTPPEQASFGGSGGGTITTGDISLAIEIVNMANENETVIDPDADEEEPDDGMGGGEIVVNPSGMGGGEVTDDSPAIEATTLPEAGTNMPLVALSLGLGGLALWTALRQLRKKVWA